MRALAALAALLEQLLARAECRTTGHLFATRTPLDASPHWVCVRHPRT